MSNSIFIPVIKSSDVDSNRASKAALRVLYTTLLGIESCAAAVAQFKTNGSIEGHKVLDDASAVDALYGSAPAELAKQIDSIRLKKWEKCQVLNQVLRRFFEMDKQGKLTGQPSKRQLLKHAA